MPLIIIGREISNLTDWYHRPRLAHFRLLRLILFFDTSLRCQHRGHVGIDILEDSCEVMLPRVELLYLLVLAGAALELDGSPDETLPDPDIELRSDLILHV